MFRLIQNTAYADLTPFNHQESHHSTLFCCFTRLTGFRSFYQSSASISCLNIWNSNLTSQEMLEAADCSSQGDLYHLAEDTIDLYGNVITFTLSHPDFLSQRFAGKWKYLCTMMIA